MGTCLEDHGAVYTGYMAVVGGRMVWGIFRKVTRRCNRDLDFAVWNRKRLEGLYAEEGGDSCFASAPSGCCVMRGVRPKVREVDDTGNCCGR